METKKYLTKVQLFTVTWYTHSAQYVQYTDLLIGLATTADSKYL